MLGTRPRLLPLLALVLLAACGSGRTRPFVVSIFPPNGSTTAGPLQEIVFKYNEPITVLNPADIQVLVDGLLFPTTISITDAEPCSITVRPSDVLFPDEGQIIARTVQGAVVNARRHPAQDIFQSVFTVGGEASIPVGSPGLVTMIDAEDFSFLSSVTTPPGRDPVGLVGTIRGPLWRVWVQLDDGAGGGDALAWFDPAAVGPMTVVTLTATGELQSARPVITAAHRGEKIYAAYRDDGSGRVRLARIDTATGLESGSIVLMSVAAGPMTMPLGIAVNEMESELYVASDDGATGTLTYVDLDTFSESDLSPAAGTQGVTLTNGAGPVAAAKNLGLVTPSANADLSRVDLTTTAITDFPSVSVAGASTDIKPSMSRNTMIQSLGAFAGTAAMTWRRFNQGTYATEVFPSVSDNVAGASAGATDALSVVWYGGTSRFALLLQSPGGALITRWAVTEPDTIEQEDLDLGTAGIQASDLSVVAPGATVAGQTFGAFAD